MKKFNLFFIAVMGISLYWFKTPVDVIAIMFVAIMHLLELPMILSAIISGFHEIKIKGLFIKNILTIGITIFISFILTCSIIWVVGYIDIRPELVNDIVYKWLGTESIEEFKSLYVPDNFFNSLVAGNIIAPVFIFYIVGIAIKGIRNYEQREVLQLLADSSYLSMNKLTEIVEYILPCGLFSLFVFNIHHIDIKTVQDFSNLILLPLLFLILLFYLTILIISKITHIKIKVTFMSIINSFLVSILSGFRSISMPYFIRDSIKGLKLDPGNVKIISPIYFITVKLGDITIYTILTLFACRVYGVPLTFSLFLWTYLVSVLGSFLSFRGGILITLPILSIMWRGYGIPIEPMYLFFISLNFILLPIREGINTLYGFLHLTIFSYIKVKKEYKSFRLPLKLVIVSIFTILLTISGGFILVKSYSFSKSSIYDLTEQTMGKISDNLSGNISSYLTPAKRAGLSIAEMLGNTDFKLTKQTIIPYLEKQMNINPEFTALYYADQQGDFYMVKKMKDNSLSIKSVSINSGKFKTTWNHKNQSYANKYKELEISDNGYDARVRDWYKKAYKLKQNSWSDIYIFNTDKLPGITNATPVYRNGSFIGVIGIDLDISSLSNYLGSMDVSAKGMVYVLDQDKNIVMKSIKNGVLTEIVNVEDTKDPIIYSAYQSGLIKDRLIPFTYNNIKYLSYYSFFEIFDGLYFSMDIIVPESYLLAGANKNLKALILFGIIVLFLSFLVILVLSEKIINPLSKLSDEFKRLRNFIFYKEHSSNELIYELDEINNDFAKVKTGIYSFSKYVPANVVRQLVKMGRVAIPGGEKKELTILFSDIKNFTNTSEKLTPEVLVKQLMGYLGSLSNIIIRKKGTIDKYIGDAIMAFWGAPEEDFNHTYNACISALECQKYLHAQKNIPFDGTRIGIHTGKVIVGNLGSEDRLNYTVIGDSVNTASRLEGLNKYYGTSIIISGVTYKEVKNKFICRKLDTVAVKGKTKGLDIYELIRLKINNEDFDNYSNQYTQAVEHFQKMEFDKSLSILNKLHTIKPDDLALKNMLTRVKDSKKSSKENWSYVNVFNTK